MTSFSPFGEKFKTTLESVMKVAVLDKRLFTDVIHISCIFIGMLVAKCVDKSDRDRILQKISGWISFYEEEHRLNLEDLKTMINRRKPGP